MIVLDADGAVCIDQNSAQQVLLESLHRYNREVSLRDRLSKGELSYDIHGLRDRVEGSGRKE
jgi:4-hydroxy-4-methyl-2-oxoglutarate aldolase